MRVRVSLASALATVAASEWVVSLNGLEPISEGTIDILQPFQEENFIEDQG